MLVPLPCFDLVNLKLGNVKDKNHPNFFIIGMCNGFSLIAGLNIMTPLSYLLLSLLARQNATAPPKLVPIIYILELGYCFFI